MPKLLHYFPVGSNGLAYKLADLYEIPELEFCPTQATKAGIAVEVQHPMRGLLVGVIEKRGADLAIFYHHGKLEGPVVPFHHKILSTLYV